MILVLVNKFVFQARIRWFDEVTGKSSDKIFVIHECNDIPIKTIICTLKVKRVSSQPTKVSVAASDCQLVEKFLSDSKDSKTTSNDSSQTSPKKTAKKKVKGKLRSNAKSRNVKASIRKKAAVVKKAAVKRKADTKPKAAPATKKKKKVTCYSNIALYQNNPVWDSKTVIPHVAPTVNSVLYTRAVKNKQYGEVKRLHKEKELFSNQYGCIIEKGFCNKLVWKSSWHYAVDNKDKVMINLLKKLQEQEIAEGASGRTKRVEATNSLLDVSCVFGIIALLH